jgi:signal transduction histidine kinase
MAHRPFLTRVTPQRNAEGQIVQWFGTNTDVYDLNRSEEELREAKKSAEEANLSKDQFLALLSHELRTPLTPVLLTADALLEEEDLPLETRETMEMVSRNIRLEVKLIDDLLDVSRITSGKMELALEPVDLNEAVNQGAAICQVRVEEKGLRLETSLDPEMGFLQADPLRLQQVIWNLLNNAIKFTPAQGTIHISTRRLGADRCELRVQDSGIGIESEALSRIFQAFERSHRDITRQFGGLGLGLAITRSVVEHHGGTIRAESAGPGEGAIFIIELPKQMTKF